MVWKVELICYLPSGQLKYINCYLGGLILTMQTPETILQAIHRRLDDGESYGKIADSIGVRKSLVQTWVRKYECFGEEYFFKNGKQIHYSLETKQQAVLFCISGKDSKSEACKLFNISGITTLSIWIKKYNSHELKASPTGGRIVMTKGRKTSLEERIEIVSECIKANCNYLEIAEKYQVSYQQVYQWVRKFKQNGIDKLVDNRGRIKPPLEMTELEKVQAENKILKAQLKEKELENIFLKKLDEIERRRS